MISYHNTLRVDADEREHREAQALRQEDAVLRHFRKVQTLMSAEEVHSAVLPTAPLTSARRALTNLASAGLLEKADQVTGQFGHRIYRWRLVKSSPTTTRDWIAEGATNA